jgi:hypothetical protein
MDSLNKNVKMKLKFIGVGMPKCATTWLTYCLDEHPRIYLPCKDRELNYFSRNKNNNWKSEYDLNGIKGYFKYFKVPEGNYIIGEMSTQYMFFEIAKIIKKHFPNTKIIITLRNPVKRAFSWYDKRLDRDLSQLEFFKQFLKDSREHLGHNNYYYEQVKPYFDLFPRENIKIILHEDIIKNPKKVLKDLFNFLGVESDFIPESTYKKINLSAQANKQKVWLFSTGLKLSCIFGQRFRLFLKKNLKFNKITPYIDRKFITNKPLEKSKIKSDIKEMLKKEYISDINKLEQLIKINLEEWKR